MTGFEPSKPRTRPAEDRPGHRTGSTEDTLKTDRIQIERKAFVFALKENPRGRFLRITEDINGRRDSIIVPAPGLEEFRRILNEMIEASNAAPEEEEPEDSV